MATSNTPGPANDDELSIGDLLAAVDMLVSDDAEQFSAAVAMLSTEPGEKMLDAIHDIAGRLFEMEEEGGEARRRIRCQIDGALTCSTMIAPPHALATLSLTALGECFPAHERTGDRRPTFKLLRWHVAGGEDLMLTPPAANREALLLVLGGTVEVSVDGARGQRLDAQSAAAALWVGSVEHEPWLPAIRLGSTGSAHGLILLLSEKGVPVVEHNASGGVGRRTGADLPVCLAPSRSGRDPAEYWAALRDWDVSGPQVFTLPRGEGTLAWTQTLPDATDPRDDLPHGHSVRNGLLRPRELPEWQLLREKLQTEEWPSLMFRVLELPSVAAGAEAEIERHDGAEALLAWHSAFTLLTRRRGASPRQRMPIQVGNEEPAVDQLELGASPVGRPDLLVIDSDYFHTLVAKDEAAVALHFTGSQVGWSDAWLAHVDKHALGEGFGMPGHGTR